MRLIHAGLVSSSEDRADRFFGGVLGLEKTRRSELSAELADRLFGVDGGCEIVYYGSGDLELEVFLIGLPRDRPGAESAISVSRWRAGPSFSRGVRRWAFAVRQAPKGDSLDRLHRGRGRQSLRDQGEAMRRAIGAGVLAAQLEIESSNAGSNRKGDS